MKKDSFSRKCFNVFNVTLMLLLIVVMGFPYLNILARSLNDGADAAKGGIIIWPRVFSLENFKMVITDEAFIKAAVISISRVVLGVSISLIVTFMGAYVFTHKHFVGRSALLMFFIIPMYFGGGLIPSYIMYSRLHLLNNYLLYILPGAFSFYNMLIIKTYMNTLPSSLREAAKLDGASEMTILWKIIIPLCKPIVATIILWTAVELWNDWTTTMYFFTKKDLYTLQYLLMEVLKETEKIRAMIQEALRRGESIAKFQGNVTTESVRCAQIIITSIPIIATYPFLQKYFIHGVTLGAVKD